MPALLRVLIPLLVVGLALTACTPRDEPEIEIEDPDDYLEDVRVLMGTWVLTEQAGAMPDRIVTLTFTQAGDYILRTEAGGEQRRQFHAAGPNLIEVMDAPGGPVEQYEYDVVGTTLTLTIPGTEAVSTFERREDLLRSRPELVPDTLGPDPVTVPLPEGPQGQGQDAEPAPDQIEPIPNDLSTDG
jgi:hypothetical protein